VVGGATVVFATVVVGAAVVVVLGRVVVEAAWVLVGASVGAIEGGVDLLFVPFPAAPAAPPTASTSATGAAIFAHRGQDRSHPIGEVASRSTLGIGAVALGETGGTGCVVADSGGYHLPSEASHQPG
jgi:hypothetical protein